MKGAAPSCPASPISRSDSGSATSAASDSEQKTNLNVTWSRRWRLRETASRQRRRRDRQRVVSRRRRSTQGITHVRIPIGHWITCDISEDEPYVCGEWTYLQRVAQWCQKYDVLVWSDSVPNQTTRRQLDGVAVPAPNSLIDLRTGWISTLRPARKTASTIPEGPATLCGISLWPTSTGRCGWSTRSLLKYQMTMLSRL